MSDQTDSATLLRKRLMKIVIVCAVVLFICIVSRIALKLDEVQQDRLPVASATFDANTFDYAAEKERAGNARAALDATSYLIRRDPNTALYYVQRGRLYSAQGLYKEAVRDYSDAIDLTSVDDPELAIAVMVARAEAFTGWGRYSDAEMDYEKARRLLDEDCDHASAKTEYASYEKAEYSIYAGKSICALRMGQKEKAIANYKILEAKGFISKRPKDMEALRSLIGVDGSGD